MAYTNGSTRRQRRHQYRQFRLENSENGVAQVGAEGWHNQLGTG